MSKGGYKGEYNAPAATSSMIRKSYTSTDSTGVEDGLSARSGFDSESNACCAVNNEVDSLTGNPRQCIKPRPSMSVSEKGNSFSIC
jgi:hypothetical protein